MFVSLRISLAGLERHVTRLSLGTTLDGPPGSFMLMLKKELLLPPDQRGLRGGC